MEASELYADHPELRTPEEEEDWNYNPRSGIRIWPERFYTLEDELPSPIAAERAAFQLRPPALGLTTAEVAAMEHKIKRASPVQRRFEFRLLQGRMLRMLIPCPGASDYGSLLAILKEELRRGTPAPVPDWYEYSKVKFGPRRIGYYACDARGCFFTEDASRQVMKCGGCNLAKYCSRDCQSADWKARHKVVCQKDKGESVKRVEQVSAILERMTRDAMGPRGIEQRRQQPRRRPAPAIHRQVQPDSGESDGDGSDAWGDWQGRLVTSNGTSGQPTGDPSFSEWFWSQWWLVAVVFVGFTLVAAAAMKELGTSRGT